MVRGELRCTLRCCAPRLGISYFLCDRAGQFVCRRALGTRYPGPGGWHGRVRVHTTPCRLQYDRAQSDASRSSRQCLTPAFTAALPRRGFAIAENGQTATPTTHRLRYWVTPLDNGDLVRLSIDDRTEASRFFVRNSRGGLQAGGPFMVRQNTEASR